MRARTLTGLVAVVALSLLAPAAVSAQTESLLADNTRVDCDAPLPSTMVAGELGSTVIVVEEGEIDKVTLAAEPGAEVVDAEFSDGGTEATIVTTADNSAYVAWSCAPLNGEPVMMNDEDEV